MENGEGYLGLGMSLIACRQVCEDAMTCQVQDYGVLAWISRSCRVTYSLAVRLQRCDTLMARDNGLWLGTSRTGHVIY